MNTTYLIDLENVNSGGFEGANNLTENDELIVFYSEKADTLKIPIIRMLLSTKAEIKFYKSKNGIMNAMDFDIVSVLGIVYDAEHDFVIVSKDKGFDVVVERYRSFGKTNVSRRVNIGAARQRPEPVTPEPAQPEPEVIQEQPAEAEEILFSAPEVPEIEPDQFEAEISKAMELTPAPAQAEPESEPESEPEEQQAEPEQAEPEEKPADKKPAKKQPVKKAAPKKKKPATAELSRLQKGKVNQFLNNLMGAKHKQPFTKEELKLIRETAESAKNKSAFYNTLRSKLGTEKGRELYQTVKDDYDKIIEYIGEIRK